MVTHFILIPHKQGTLISHHKSGICSCRIGATSAGSGRGRLTVAKEGGDGAIRWSETCWSGGRAGDGTTSCRSKRWRDAILPELLSPLDSNGGRQIGELGDVELQQGAATEWRWCTALLLFLCLAKNADAKGIERKKRKKRKKRKEEEVAVVARWCCWRCCRNGEGEGMGRAWG
ncbi:hypothetical protein JCGZ_25433 [Jatropha curcas]|uniref:Uncharacterized protein n=1 Tax=Jatropha curcas TaxID=180498 RepID=A0A067JZ16_JATCU|nr:hypothetical protein JCGZ_25433 [Jatropha curcas]